MVMRYERLMETECRPCSLPLSVCRCSEGGLEETRGAFNVLRGEDELEGHMRFNRFFSMC